MTERAELAEETVEPSTEEPRHARPLAWRSYKEVVATLADRIVEAQRPIRLLQSIRWATGVEEEFFRDRMRELPMVDAAYYEGLELGFEPDAKLDELEEIARDAERELGKSDELGAILMATALDYRDLARMLAARGTKEFHRLSKELFGSPADRLVASGATLRDLGHRLYQRLSAIGDVGSRDDDARTLSAEACATELNRRFSSYFVDDRVVASIDEDILADACAGSDYVKIRDGARFSPSDVDILEVHEGWVHVATSLNGQAQAVARWLAKGPPRVTTLQEGLAVLLELITLRSHPRRARRLCDRLIAVDKAEAGGSFLDVFEWFRTEGYDERECFANTSRVFRGGVVKGGAPFTKDACYIRGIVLDYAFIRCAIEQKRPELVPFLFVGKVTHEDIPVLARRALDGVVRAPRYVPAMFRSPGGLGTWVAFASFFADLDVDAVVGDFARSFAKR